MATVERVDVNDMWFGITPTSPIDHLVLPGTTVTSDGWGTALCGTVVSVEHRFNSQEPQTREGEYGHRSPHNGVACKRCMGSRKLTGVAQ